MQKVLIVGNNQPTLDSSIKNVIEKDKYIVYQDKIEEVFEYKNPYAFLNDKPLPSKSRLKKCEKGLHEYSETSQVEETELGTRKLWACIHCGTFMHNH